MAYPAASSTSWPTALDGADRTGILARRPYHGCRSRPDSGSGSSGGVVSLYAPFLDPRGHQRACTGKRPVSRGEARLAYNSGGDEASFTSGVPHHTPPDLPVSAPLLSHTPTPVGSLVKGDIKGQGDDDDKGGRQQTCHIPPPPKRHPRPTAAAHTGVLPSSTRLQRSEWAGIPLRATLPLARHSGTGTEKPDFRRQPQPTTGK